jgi:hypothetical protein
MKSPKGLKRVSIAITLLGVLHLAMSLMVWKANWKGLPLEASLASLFMYVGTGLWIAGSGLLMGMMGAAGEADAHWPGPLARGTSSLLVLGGLAAMALMWSDPESWALLGLACLARWFARKAPEPMPTFED